MNLNKVINMITPTNEIQKIRSRARWDSIAKPLNSLGRLEEAIIKLAGIANSDFIDINKRCVVVMCADNGVVKEGITQVGSEVTTIVAKSLVCGKATINKMASVANADVIPIDIGMLNNVEGLSTKKVANGTGNIAIGPAMLKEDCIKTIEIGINLVKELKENGYKIIATGEMGIGNTTTSSALSSILLSRQPSEVTGRGAGISNLAFNNKIEVIRKAIKNNKPNKDDILDTLASLGGFDIAGLVGVFLGGALYKVPIIIDGFISSVSALIATRLSPFVLDYILPSHVSNEPAGAIILKEMNLKPFITCDMCLGEGTGAVAVLPLLDMACEVYNQMSTFLEINLEQYKKLY